MAVNVLGATLEGIEASPIEVEVDLLRRLPGVCIVGLAAGAVKEAAERVRSAIVGSELEFPRKRVIVNLAPADIRKDGCAFDLPIALGILAADGQIPLAGLKDILAVGELSLGGAMRAVHGAVALALLARKLDKVLILPRASAGQAAIVPGVRVLEAESLRDVVAHLRGERPLAEAHDEREPERENTLDMSDVRGQPIARRALEIAAAGAHHLLMMGPPGCGKSMLARRMPTILPEMTFEESLEVTQIHSAAGLLRADAGLVRERPFRAPHHSVTAAGLIGDRTLRPGEVSLAHHGVLFLDETPEFSRHVLESLRAPVEDREVRLVRAQGTLRLPSAVTLVLAANPCPCGLRGSALPCRCSDGDVVRYMRRLSGPLLDRIDLHVSLSAVSAEAMLGGKPGESSAAVRARVVAARQRQRARGQSAPNAQLDPGALSSVLQLTDAAQHRLYQAMRKFSMSGRGAMRVSRVARTIADLAAHQSVDTADIDEALGFRPVESAVTPVFI